MIACAADEIIADPHSIVGSIGVVGSSFGFDKLIAKLGIERRLYIAGDHKAMLDPFLPENPDDVERLKKLQREIHEDFIALVKSRRGSKLAGPENDLFSGEYWTGRRGLELGLVDSIGEVRSTLRDRFGDKVVTPLIAAERRLFGRRVGGIGRGDLMGAGAGLAEDVISALEARALWARYGL
jgi:serine protease SohB